MLPLLAGDGAQNLVKWSEQLENDPGGSGWGDVNLTVSADTGESAAPDGSSTAEKMEPTTANAQLLSTSSSGHRVPVNANHTYTFSIWLKSATGGDVAMALSIRKINLTLISANKDITVTTAWQRFWVSVGVGSETEARLSVGGGNKWSSGEDVYGWGAQMNEGPTAGPYVKTTDARIG